MWSGPIEHWEHECPISADIARRDGLTERAELQVPMAVADAGLGVIAVRRNTARAYGPEHVALLQSFATQAAIALRTARVIGELQHNAILRLRKRSGAKKPAVQDFIARLAALVPRPRVNLTRYHGVFAPSSPFRQLILPTSRKSSRRQNRTAPDDQPNEKNEKNNQNHHATAMTEPPTAPLSWTQRLKRVFNIDITLCPFCGGQLRVIGDVTNPELIRKILDHLQQRAPPRRPPARAQTHQSLPDRFAER